MALGPPQMASTVARFSVPVTRRRYEPSTTNADGLQASAGYTDTPIQAHVFPAKPKTLERMPEGHSSSNTIEGHAASDELRTILEGSEIPGDRYRADVLIVDGEQFEIFEASRWREGPAGAAVWFAVVAVKVKRP